MPDFDVLVEVWHFSSIKEETIILLFYFKKIIVYYSTSVLSLVFGDVLGIAIIDLERLL